MNIGIPKETYQNESRVAITPDTASKLIILGFNVKFESGAGLNSSFTDEEFINAGAEKLNSAAELYDAVDVVIRVQRPRTSEDLSMFKQGTTLISFFYPMIDPSLSKFAAEKGINVLAMDLVPRTTLAQKMDALSSQMNLAGYKSVLIAGNELGKIFPLMMTAAGTIKPSKVVIMGAGVAGLQALGTAKRLGAIVEVSDIRAAVKEEVLSLGGRFIEVDTDEDMQDEKGYAKEASEEFLKKQKELIFKHITEADIVITTALIPGKKAPVLVTEDMIKSMRQGSVVLDMAVEFGGNCELSEMDKVVEKHGVKIIGYSNLPSMVPVNASELYSKNVLSLLQYISKEGNIEFNLEDEIISSMLVTYNGEIKLPQLLENLKSSD